MKKIFFTFSGLIMFVGVFSLVNAANIFSITYPITELGNCADQTECKAYCDILENQDACVLFAEKNGFLSQDKIEKYKELDRLATQGGPGGCTTRKECHTYCADTTHQDECIAFAKEHGLMKEKKESAIDILLAQGGPGGCKSEKECKAFCSNPVNQDVCLQFAADNNLISKERLAQIQKFKEISEQGGPGGCTDKESCRLYCADTTHQDECIAFAKEHKLIDSNEVTKMERARELARKIKEISGPGDCKSERECRIFCEKEENIDACLAFAVEHGGFKQEEVKNMIKEFLKEKRKSNSTSTEDIMELENEHMNALERFREIEGKFRKSEYFQQGQISGPGNCSSAQECIRYCSDPSHRSECAQFNPSTGNLPPGMIFRESKPGIEGEINKMRASSSSSMEYKGNEMPFGILKPELKKEKNDTELRLKVCTQEFKPVCGSDGRTYPNECFAKNNNAIIVKEGVCNSLGNTPSSILPLRDREIKNIQPLVIPENETTYPQSRNVSDVSFGMVWQAFRNIMPH